MWAAPSHSSAGNDRPSNDPRCVVNVHHPKTREHNVWLKFGAFCTEMHEMHIEYCLHIEVVDVEVLQYMSRAENELVYLLIHSGPSYFSGRDYITDLIPLQPTK